MAKASKFQFVLKSEADRSKPALLYVMFTLDKRYKISLQESVLPQWWDKETQRAIVIESGQQKQVDTRNAKRVNRFLDYAEKEFKDIFEVHKEWRRVKTAVIASPYPFQITRLIRNVITEYHNKELEETKKQNQTPTQYFEEYIAKLPTHTIRRTGTVMKPQTIGNHRIVLNRFKNFLRHYGLTDSFRLFDKHFEENSVKSDVSGFYEESRDANREQIYVLYGGLFFIGIFLGTMFLMVTVMIIFYKQISEGYDDKARYEIMEKVGMSNDEVKKSITSQVRMVFFLPIMLAACHLAAAFPLLRRLLAMCNLTDVKLIVICMVATFFVFMVIYYIVFKITSRAYYRIVGNQI